MPEEPRALILDDDPDSVELMTYALRQVLPDVAVQTRATPEPLDGFDLYVLDNDFDGEYRAGQLATEIRARQPNSLIVAFSACLDAPSLKHLINAGCNGAFEKGSREELDRMLRFVVERLLESDQESSSIGRQSFLATVRAIAALIRLWNRRLEMSRTAWIAPGEDGIAGTA